MDGPSFIPLLAHSAFKFVKNVYFGTSVIESNFRSLKWSGPSKGACNEIQRLIIKKNTCWRWNNTIAVLVLKHWPLLQNVDLIITTEWMNELGF